MASDREEDEIIGEQRAGAYWRPATRLASSTALTLDGKETRKRACRVLEYNAKIMNDVSMLKGGSGSRLNIQQKS